MLRNNSSAITPHLRILSLLQWFGNKKTSSRIINKKLATGIIGLSYHHSHNISTSSNNNIIGNNRKFLKLENVKYNLLKDLNGIVGNIKHDRTYAQKVDEFLTDIHEKVFSKTYTTKIFHVAVDGYNQKKYKEAAEFFTKVIEKGREVIAISKNPPVKEFNIEKQIFWSFIYRGVITNSYQDLQKAKQINPFHPEVFYRRGNLFYFENDFSCAIKDYSKAIANNPNFKECNFNRGLCYFQMKRFDMAIKDLEKYLEHSPNDPNTLKILGISYYYEYVLHDSRRELLLKSIESLTRYIEHRKSHNLPITKEDYFTRGKALIELRQNDLAQQDFNSGANSSIQNFTPPIIITPVDCFPQERIVLVNL